jgi:methanogenic corrinoid protein MtbC1
MKSIGDVVSEIGRFYPDVTHSSLRFLEREGLISASRTAGGHRLYAPTEIERVLQIKRWQQQKLSLQEIRDRLAHHDSLPTADKLVSEFLRRSASGELDNARQAILDAANAGLPLERLFGEVLVPALFEAGVRWQRGELMVAQEKEISEVARELITELTLRHSFTNSSAPVLVAACVEGEHHELGLRMICGLLRARGFTIHFLGGNVAPRFLQESVSLHRPAAVLLSATLVERLPAVEAAIGALLESTQPPSIVVGGHVAKDHPDTIRAWGAIPISDRFLDQALEAILPLLVVSG